MNNCLKDNIPPLEKEQLLQQNFCAISNFSTVNHANFAYK